MGTVEKKWYVIGNSEQDWYVVGQGTTPGDAVRTAGLDWDRDDEFVVYEVVGTPTTLKATLALVVQ